MAKNNARFIIYLLMMIMSGAACSSDSQGAADDEGVDDADVGADAEADAQAEAEADVGGGGDFRCQIQPGPSLGDCSECVDEKCSDLLPFCEDAECACIVECIRQQGIGAIDGCLAQHGLAERPSGLNQLEECLAFACPDRDECATPDDWTPPSADLVCDGTGTGGLGAGAEADCVFDPDLPYDPLGEVLQLQAPDGSFCVRVERRDEGPGRLENTSWTLLDIRLGPPGEVVHVDAQADLCWYSSHHNFRDWAHISTDTRHYDLVFKEDGHGGTEEGHDGQRRFHLYVFEQGPAAGRGCAPTADGVGCVQGPIILEPVRGGQ